MLTQNLNKTYLGIQKQQQYDLTPISGTTSSLLSDSIIKKAIEKDIPIYENIELLSMIARLDLLKDVPDEYYSAVGEIVRYIYTVDNNKVKA